MIDLIVFNNVHYMYCNSAHYMLIYIYNYLEPFISESEDFYEKNNQWQEVRYRDR